MISRLIRMFVTGKVISMVLRWFRGRRGGGDPGSAPPRA